MRFKKDKKILMVLSALPLHAFAAATLPDIQPNIPRPLLQERIPVPAAPVQLPETATSTAKLPKIKISVTAFKFSGNKAFTDAQLAAELAEYLNHEIGVRELNLALRKVQDLYRQHGYLLAQAYLPAQDIQKSSGAPAEVEIAILEGILGDVSVEAPQGMDIDFLKSMASYNLDKGGPIYEKNLIRNLTTINDLPGLTMTSLLNPGQDVGSSDVAVSVQPRKASTYVLFANTFGNRFTGREQFGAAATFNNLAGRGDQLSLLARSSNSEDQRLFSALYVTPVHASGTLLTLSYSFVDYELGKEFKDLGARGDASYLSAYVDQPIFRDTIKGVFGRVGANYKVLDDDVRALGLNNRRDVSSIELGVAGDWVSPSSDVLYQWSATVTQGNVSFKDQIAEANDRLGLNTQGSFFKWNLTSTRSQYFENGVNWVLRADYQGASDNLDIVEKIGVGAINRWRQFAELPSLADQGYMVGTDIKRSWTISSESAGQIFRTLTPFAFFDHGRGRINHNPLSGDNHVKSSHYGVGIDFQMINQWNFGVTFSEQKRDLDGAGSDTENRLWAQLRKEF